MKKFEIWAAFADGIEARVEVHKSLKTARNAIDAMNNANMRDLSEGYGFPHGVPTYYIIRC